MARALPQPRAAGAHAVGDGPGPRDLPAPHRPAACAVAEPRPLLRRRRHHHAPRARGPRPRQDAPDKRGGSVVKIAIEDDVGPRRRPGRGDPRPRCGARCSGGDGRAQGADRADEVLRGHDHATRPPRRCGCRTPPSNVTGRWRARGSSRIMHGGPPPSPAACPMDARWSRLEGLFHEALALPPPERAALIRARPPATTRSPPRCWRCSTRTTTRQRAARRAAVQAMPTGMRLGPYAIDRVLGRRRHGHRLPGPPRRPPVSTSTSRSSWSTRGWRRRSSGDRFEHRAAHPGAARSSERRAPARRRTQRVRPAVPGDGVGGRRAARRLAAPANTPSLERRARAVARRRRRCRLRASHTWSCTAISNRRTCW